MPAPLFSLGGPDHLESPPDVRAPSRTVRPQCTGCAARLGGGPRRIGRVRRADLRGRGGARVPTRSRRGGRAGEDAVARSAGTSTLRPGRPSGDAGRRIRVLGEDSWYRSGADDPELASIAVTEGRILLSRDRRLLMRRAVVHGYCPRSDDPDQQLDEVVRRYRLAGDATPLTRCPRGNGMLVEATRTEVGGRVPARTRRAFSRLARCEGCGRIYWPGAHRSALERVISRARGRPPAGSRRP